MALSLFGAAAAFIFYALFGYPLLLWFWGRLRPRPIHRAPYFPSVSVLIPFRNGEQWILPKLKSVSDLHYPPELLEVIVIDDHSTDNGRALAAAVSNVHVISSPGTGKAAALNAGMAQATGEIVFFTDVRQLLHPECLARLTACFSDPKVGVASGELILTKGDREEHAQLGLYVRFEEWLRKQISLVGSVPGATGAVYALRRKLAVPLPEDVLLDDVYQPLAAYFQGYRVILEGDAIAYDVPTQLGHEFQRKVRTLAGIFQILIYFPKLWDPRYDIWFHFQSHKLVRLLLPYGFLVIALTSFWLPDPWRGILLAGQAAFYLLALADFVIPEKIPLKKISSLIRTFVTLLAASLSAASILFRPARSLWVERR